MGEVLRFFHELGRVVTSVGFYRDILKRPIKEAWGFYFILLCLASLINSIFIAIPLISIINEAGDFFSENIIIVEFVDGRVENFPITHKELHFKQWTIHIDSSYINEESVGKDIDEDQFPILFIGPQIAVIISDQTPVSISYPSNFNSVIDTEKLESYKTYLIVLMNVVLIAGLFLFKLITSMLYMVLLITPVVLFKFRRMGLAYRVGFHASLYLISFQIIISSLLMIAGIMALWSFLLFILFYFIYIGAFVNIDVSGSERIIIKG